MGTCKKRSVAMGRSDVCFTVQHLLRTWAEPVVQLSSGNESSQSETPNQVLRKADTNAL